MVFNKLNLNFNKEKVRCHIFEERLALVAGVGVGSAAEATGQSTHRRIHAAYWGGHLSRGRAPCSGLDAAAHQQQQPQLLLTVKLMFVHGTLSICASMEQ
jgi:hypothetical protein